MPLGSAPGGYLLVAVGYSRGAPCLPSTRQMEKMLVWGEALPPHTASAGPRRERHVRIAPLGCGHAHQQYVATSARPSSHLDIH